MCGSYNVRDVSIGGACEAAGRAMQNGTTQKATNNFASDRLKEYYDSLVTTMKLHSIIGSRPPLPKGIEQASDFPRLSKTKASQDSSQAFKSLVAGIELNSLLGPISLLNKQSTNLRRMTSF